MPGPKKAEARVSSPADCHAASFRGNKAALPSKLCAVCGLTMSWRKRWAKNWAQVKVCSEACRRQNKSGA
ncbi:MAG: DUF2256 domain-containing protein [Burkholderiales bacterium]